MPGVRFQLSTIVHASGDNEEIQITASSLKSDIAGQIPNSRCQFEVGTIKILTDSHVEVRRIIFGKESADVALLCRQCGGRRSSL